MKKLAKLLLVVYFINLPVLYSASLDPKNLVKQSFDMWRGDRSSVASMKMHIHRPNREQDMSMKSWSKGDDLSIVKFTNPARYKGQSILVRGDSMWNYSPKSKRSIKISSSLKSQSWMGSDMSYDDISVSLESLDYYNYKIIDEQTSKKGKKLYIIEATPKKDAPIVWGKEVYAIDVDSVMWWKKFYDQGGNLVKRFQTIEIDYVDDMPIMKHMRVYSVEKEDYYTDFMMQDVSFDQTLPDKLFTLTNLSKP